MSSKKQDLETKIEELETAISGLKTQLRQIEVEEQHQAIDNLDEYLAMMDNKWENLREFWGIVSSELRELFGKSNKSGENSST
ncbi:hypothetical protein [Candidatus Macondimonas diazotrophica]|jgi:peptidoglycan hydrolase CwlO-like protein|uniref:Uncharacterized protein n=1 Tax=Candidatus Macondimonas diazotrophica TaxID=2305248 RepID=A0A4Z0F788_9GAMM|nr:hypothetical protein [Candidatus Macondimonas diazotrophica]NCU01073.1 hypothetical protein [Candidatus Macondimonas diazotrophica]TFZ82150.1 hypothetical protein E4680_08990 [Candidatus Macondimonas diazotrophica]HBG31792.1 hypothetical protein [Gammaproteobacteria bacterium]HBG51514.1 hypothetical protein [Gammaproteobacteria bacterium]